MKPLLSRLAAFTLLVVLALPGAAAAQTGCGRRPTVHPRSG